MVKKIFQFILLLIFIAFVICAIVVGSYMLNHPATDGDTRVLITGAWVDEDKNVKLEFTEDSKFKISENDSDFVIADGYFKVDEEAKKIKLFMLPGHHDSSFEKSVDMMFFAQLSYTDLKDPAAGLEKEQKENAAPATITFLVNKSNNVYNCKMPERTLDLYSKGKSFEEKK